MGGGGSSQAPQAPDPGQVSRDQTQSNVNTAIANAYIGNTNQKTPYGSLTYNQTGTKNVAGNEVPQFEAVQTLSPDQQKIYDSQTALTNQAYGQIAPDLLNRIQSTVGQPLDYSSAAALPTDQTQLRNDAYGALTARSNQDLDRQQNQQRTQLANQGIAAGTEAYNNAMQPIDRARVDASNQATLQAGNLAGQNLSQAQSLRGSQIADITNLRNSPLQDYASLTGVSGGPTQATYAPGSAGTVAPTDVASNYYNSYNGQLQQYQMGQQQNNALMGGLFGLGGSILGGAARGFAGCDEALKEDIVPIAIEPKTGLMFFAFRYKGDPKTYPKVIAPMAQDVKAKYPDMVQEIAGVLTIKPEFWKLV